MSYYSRDNILRTQGPLLLLITTMFGLWLAQETATNEWDIPFKVVPAHITESWQHLRAGTFGTADLRHFGTLLTYAFLHADFAHVGFNMIYLWIFAALVVEELGQVWSALIFILTAIGGGVAHSLLDPDKLTPMLGASGAVMGFEGAYLGLALRRPLHDPHVWPMAHPIPPSQLAILALIGVVFDFRDMIGGELDFIAHGAHIGGFIVGLFLTSLVLPANAGTNREY